MVQTSHYCATCQRQTLHTKERTSHVLHLLLSVLTAGIWLIVWAALGMANSVERTRCSACGTQPGLAALKHHVGEAFGATTGKSSHGAGAALKQFSDAFGAAAAKPAQGAGEVPPSTWLPPGARPPRS